MAITDKSSGFYVAEGIVFILLGIAALCVPSLFTLSFSMMLGWLFLIAGFFQAFRIFQTKDAPGFLWALLSSILLIVAGVIMLTNPFSGAFTLTILLAVFFLIDGIAKIILSFQLHVNKFAIFIGGLIELALAWIIWKEWPISGTWFIGTLIGVWLILSGITALSYGLRHRKNTI